MYVKLVELSSVNNIIANPPSPHITLFPYVAVSLAYLFPLLRDALPTHA